MMSLLKKKFNWKKFNWSAATVDDVTKALLADGGDVNRSILYRFSDIPRDTIFAESKSFLEDNSLLSFATKSGNIPVIDFLLEHGADPNFKGRTLQVSFVKRTLEDVDGVRYTKRETFHKKGTYLLSERVFHNDFFQKNEEIAEKIFHLFLKHIKNPTTELRITLTKAAMNSGKESRLKAVLKKFPLSEKDKKYFTEELSIIDGPAYRTPNWCYVKRILLESEQAERIGLRKRLAEADKYGNKEKKEKLINLLVGPTKRKWLFFKSRSEDPYRKRRAVHIWEHLKERRKKR